jgi:hypothetical protein
MVEHFLMETIVLVSLQTTRMFLRFRETSEREKQYESEIEEICSRYEDIFGSFYCNIPQLPSSQYNATGTVPECEPSPQLPWNSKKALVRPNGNPFSSRVLKNHCSRFYQIACFSCSSRLPNEIKAYQSIRVKSEEQYDDD